MKALSKILLLNLSIIATACPMADPPPPVAPLSVPKTQKVSFKSAVCRLEMPWMRYDDEGKLIFSYYSDIYEYDENGFVTKMIFHNKDEVFYEYDGNGLVKKETFVYSPDNIALWRSYIRYFREGVLYDIESITSNGETLRSYEIDPEGKVRKAYLPLWDQEQGRYYLDTSLFHEYEYDSNGNVIAARTFGSLMYPGTLSQEMTWEFDSNPNPFNHVPKGHPYNPLEKPVNNVVSWRYIIYADDGYEKEFEKADYYTYEYNQNGYPEKKWYQWELIIQNGEPVKDSKISEKASPYIYQYTGCSGN